MGGAACWNEITRSQWCGLFRSNACLAFPWADDERVAARTLVKTLWREFLDFWSLDESYCCYSDLLKDAVVKHDAHQDDNHHQAAGWSFGEKVLSSASGKTRVSVILREHCDDGDDDVEFVATDVSPDRRMKMICPLSGSRIQTAA